MAVAEPVAGLGLLQAGSLQPPRGPSRFLLVMAAGTPARAGQVAGQEPICHTAPRIPAGSDPLCPQALPLELWLQKGKEAQVWLLQDGLVAFRPWSQVIFVVCSCAPSVVSLGRAEAGSALGKALLGLRNGACDRASGAGSRLVSGAPLAQ